MKLNIYDNEHTTIIKTYTADTYDLFFGTLEDVAQAVGLDDVKDGSKREILDMVMTFMLHGTKVAKGIMKDIFKGLTDEELRNCKTKDMAKVLTEVVLYAIEQLGEGIDEKN